MFANQMLKDKLSLKQQSEQSSECQQNEDIEQNDFTFDQYIHQAQDGIQMNNQAGRQLENQNDQQENQQLTMLKEHILTIEAIAMKEIQELKRQLQEERKEKQHFQIQLKQYKQINSLPLSSSETDSQEMIQLLKQQNKILKQALKKQLQINKNLIKNSLASNIETPIQNQDKQNFFQNANLPEENQKSPIKFPLFDKPSIPLPCSQAKKPILRG